MYWNIMLKFAAGIYASAGLCWMDVVYAWVLGAFAITLVN